MTKIKTVYFEGVSGVGKSIIMHSFRGFTEHKYVCFERGPLGHILDNAMYNRKATIHELNDHYDHLLKDSLVVMVIQNYNTYVTQYFEKLGFSESNYFFNASIELIEMLKKISHNFMTIDNSFIPNTSQFKRVEDLCYDIGSKIKNLERGL